MNKNGIYVVSAILIVLLVLTACGAGKGVMYEEAPPQSSPQEGVNDESYHSGEGGSIAIGAIPSVRKVIQNASVDLYVEDVAESIDRIKEKAVQLGGYVSKGGVYEYEVGKKRGNMEIRVPSEALDNFLDFLTGLGRVVNQDFYTEDITEEYYDIESRLKNAKAQERQYLKIMEEADTISDILEVQKALDSVQERIEQFEGKIRMWDSLVDYSTVSLHVSPEERFVEERSQEIKVISMDEIWLGIRNGLETTGRFTLNVLGYLVIALFYLLIPVGLIGVVVFIILFLVRRRKKPKNNHKQTE